jgi:antitoxin PrlF
MQNVMSAPLEAESTLTDRYQTTVPETVRRALRLKKRDKIRYTIRSSGEVVLPCGGRRGGRPRVGSVPRLSGS